MVNFDHAKAWGVRSLRGAHGPPGAHATRQTPCPNPPTQITPTHLKEQRGQLLEEALENQVLLAQRADPDAGGDENHVEGGAGGVLLDAQGHAAAVDEPRHEGLGHLNEGDGEVEVGGVGQPERGRVQHADGQHAAAVLVRAQVVRLADAKHADAQEADRRAEAHVPHGQRDGEGEARVRQQPGCARVSVGGVVFEVRRQERPGGYAQGR